MKHLLLYVLISYAATFASSNNHIYWPYVHSSKRVSEPRPNRGRRLEDGYINHGWLLDYSIKFLGCYNISQWNSKADDNSDVRIVAKKLVRFRVCASDTCDPSNMKGCDSEYADYVLDLHTFLYNYFPARQEYYQFHCEYIATNVCSCGGDIDCLSSCYGTHGMSNACAQYGTDDDSQTSSFDARDFMYCSEAGLEDQYGRQLYIGPFCSGKGRQIRLGVFTDDSCTNFVDASKGAKTYYALTGSKLMYSDEGFVDTDCLSCAERSQKYGDGNQDDVANQFTVTEACAQLYSMAGKCEATLAYNAVAQKNNNACRFIRGLKIIRQEAKPNIEEPVGNHVVSLLIGLFAVSFTFLSAYVYRLQIKIQRMSIRINAASF